MAVVKGRILERIPGKAQYSFLEIEAANVNEFNNLRDEALGSAGLAHYAFALEAPSNAGAAGASTAVVKAAMKAAKAKGADVEVEEVAAEAVDVSGASQADEQASSASTPTEEGPQSPRDIARARLLAKKEAK